MMIEGLAACGGLLLFLVLGGALGHACFAAVRVPRSTRQEPLELLGAIGLGWALISLALLGLGWIGAFHTAAFLLILLLCAAIGNAHIPWFLQAWVRARATWRHAWIRSTRLERFAVWLCAIHAVVSLIAAWAPVTFWDALVYHLGLPKLFLWHERVIGVSDGNVFGAGSLGAEMLYSLGLACGNTLWPSVLHWMYGVLCALTLYWIGRTWWHHTAGVWAAVCLYCSPLLNTLGGGPFIDLALLWYAALAVWALGQWVQSPRRTAVAMIGLWAGCGASVKFSGLQLIIIFAALVGVATLRQRRGVWLALREAGVLLVAGGLVVSPWLARSLVEHGTLSYVANTMRAIGYEYPRPLWSAVISEPSLARALALAADVLTLPWRLTWDPFAFDGWRFSPGPWLAMLLPLLLVCRWDRRVGWIVAASLCILWSGYLNSIHVSRLLSAAYPGLALAGGYVVWRVSTWRARVKHLIPGMLCAWGLCNLGLLMAQDLGRLPPIIGQETREEYLSRRIESFQLMRYANTVLPRDALVCMMESRVYYLERNYRLADPGYQTWLRLHPEETVETLLETLADAGITHLLVNWQYAMRVTSSPERARWQHFRALWDHGANNAFRLIRADGPVALYAFQRPDAS